MRTLMICEIGIFFLCCGWTLPCWAHRLIPDDGSHINADTAIVVQDPNLSQVIYHTVTTESPHLWLTFNNIQGANLHLQTGIPHLERLTDYRPSLALLGPELPPIELPFPIPEGYGGLLLSTQQSAPEEFYEPFTGTLSWMLLTQDITLPSTTQYYLVAFGPEGTTGKLFVVLGKREEFNLQDLLTYPNTVQYVRQFYEISDEPLPFLPRMITAISKILRFILLRF